LVQPQEGVTIARIAARHNATVQEQIPGSNLYTLYGDDDLKDRLANDPEVFAVEGNDPVEAPEPAVGDPFHFPTEFRAQPSPVFDANLKNQLDISPPPPQGRSHTSTLTVAVLDTGVARDHPMLQGRLLPGYNTLNNSTNDAEVPDGIHNRGMGHGTMVAGVIARLAPNAKILPIRVLNGDGIGSVLSVIKGIQYALSRGARVINISCGIKRRSSAFEEVFKKLADQHALIVASAGNENSPEGGYPARISHVLAVGAVEADDTKSPYSNYGSWVSVVAPGTEMESAWWQGGYANWSGTSFATPCVAAEVAVLLHAFPDLDLNTVGDIIKETARSVDDANPAHRGKLGKGIAQFQAALNRAWRGGS
jgi:subtilisin family serine protease